jgi:hypothetical protein
MNIVNCSIFIDIERYQKINIRARRAEEVYPPTPTMSVENNIGFLKQCLQKIPKVNFVDQVTGTLYLRVEDGIFRVLDDRIMQTQLKDIERSRIFMAIAPHLSSAARNRSTFSEPENG